MLRTMRRITSREQQHQGEEDPHQGQGDGDGAKVPADAFPQSVDPQQHAVKIAQFGPADIARQQTQPSPVIMDKRAAQQLLLARRQQGQDIPRRGRSQQVQMAIIKLVLSLLSPCMALTKNALISLTEKSIASTPRQ